MKEKKKKKVYIKEIDFVVIVFTLLNLKGRSSTQELKQIWQKNIQKTQYTKASYMEKENQYHNNFHRKKEFWLSHGKNNLVIISQIYQWIFSKGEKSIPSLGITGVRREVGIFLNPIYYKK